MAGIIDIIMDASMQCHIIQRICTVDLVNLVVTLFSRIEI